MCGGGGGRRRGGGGEWIDKFRANIFFSANFRSQFSFNIFILVSRYANSFFTWFAALANNLFTNSPSLNREEHTNQNKHIIWQPDLAHDEMG